MHASSLGSSRLRVFVHSSVSSADAGGGLAAMRNDPRNDRADLETLWLLILSQSRTFHAHEALIREFKKSDEEARRVLFSYSIYLCYLCVLDTVQPCCCCANLILES